MVNIDEIIFYLKCQYLAYNAQERTFIPNILSKENMPSFEAITGYLKTFSKSIKEDENMGLKNKTLIGGWILITSKVYRRQNLSCRFEDWLYEECKINRRTNYNYRNLYKLMSVAPKLMKCRVNFLNILIKKHKHPGNMRFSAHVKIVFLTLENLLLYTNKVFKFCKSISRG